MVGKRLFSHCSFLSASQKPQPVKVGVFYLFGRVIKVLIFFVESVFSDKPKVNASRVRGMIPYVDYPRGKDEYSKVFAVTMTVYIAIKRIIYCCNVFHIL